MDKKLKRKHNRFRRVSIYNKIKCGDVNASVIRWFIRYEDR